MDLSTIGAVVGATLMIGSPAHWGWWRRQVARHWTLVDGVVVRLEPSGGSAETDVCYHPVIRAKRPDGETVVFRSPYGLGPSPWKVGTVVTVRVRGDVAQHDSFGAAFLGYGSLFIIGASMLIAANS